MKLVNYRCEACLTEIEELFQDSETPPDKLEEACPACDCLETLKKWNFKKNDQVRKYLS